VSNRKTMNYFALLMALGVVTGLQSATQAAAINVIGSDFVTAGDNTEGTTVTTSFDPGANATAIVVMVSQEASGGNPGVSFNSVDLTPVGTAVAGSTLGFYYLNNPATGGAFDLEIDYTSIDTVNFALAAIVSLEATDLIEPTASLISANGGNSVTLNVPDDDSFVMSAANYNFGTNGTGLEMMSSVSMTTIFPVPATDSQINSGGAGAAFAQDVAAGNSTYGYNFTNSNGSPAARRAGAAAFSVIPEPATLALLASGCLLMAGRRRQKA